MSPPRTPTSGDQDQGQPPRPVLCPKCQRPKATPRDVIRWRSDVSGYELACFDGVEHSRLLPEEEALPGAELLKGKIAELRRQKDWLLCSAVAGVTRR